MTKFLRSRWLVLSLLAIFATGLSVPLAAAMVTEVVTTQLTSSGEAIILETRIIEVPDEPAVITNPLPQTIHSDTQITFIHWLRAIGLFLFIVVFTFLIVTDLVLSRLVALILAKTDDSYRFRRTGYVFDAVTKQGVPFALITIQGKNHQGIEIQKTCVSDVEGRYSSIVVPAGRYQITATRQNYHFPTLQRRPIFIPPQDFYLGETLFSRGERLLDLMIPMDLTGEDPNISSDRHVVTHQFLWQHWQSLRRSQLTFEISIFVLSLVGLLLRPHPLYLTTVVVYAAFLLRRLFSHFHRSILFGLVVDSDGTPVPRATIEIHRGQDGTGQEILAVADDEGRFTIRLARGQYLAHATKNGYISTNQARTVNMDETIVIDAKTKNILLKLMKAPAITEDFFFQDDCSPLDATCTDSTTDTPES